MTCARLLPGAELMTPAAQDLLDEHCLKCHGPVKTKAGVDLRGLSQILAGGDSGPILIPGDPEDSRLIQVLAPGADPHMPPKGQLSDEAIETLRLWVTELPNTIADHKGPFAPARAAATTPPRQLPPLDANPTAIIDQLIQAGFDRFGVEPNGFIDDAHFLRRATLDLAGRLPTPDERAAFLADDAPDARSRWIDRLLLGPDYAIRMAEIFDVALMGRADDRRWSQRKESGWLDYLRQAFAQNRPWDDVVRELILARPKDAQDRGSVWFLYERRDDHQAMAEAVAPLAFGTQIACAQCHDHPLASEIEQAHYWGLVTAFNRSSNTRTPEGAGLDEAATGGFVKFANLQKETQAAVLKFLNGVTIAESQPSGAEASEDRPELYTVPPPTEGQPKEQVTVPKFSRREALANAATQENPLLAKALVNRVWALLMGRGLVDPVDEINSRHPPSHPALLAWLSRDFERSGYDIRRLVRAIALSDAYRRQPASADSAPVAPETFAYAIEKMLTAEDLFRCYTVALTGHAPHRVQNDALNALESVLREVFPDVMPAVYNATMPQAMFLSNAPEFDRALRRAGAGWIEHLTTIQSNDALIASLYVRAFGRAPDATERAAITAFLGETKARSPDRLANLLWATLTSAEFQLNY